MTEKPARSQTLLPFHISGSGAVFLLSGVALLACGCSVRKGPSIPWAKAVQVKPVLQAGAAGDDIASVAAPELKFEGPSFTTVVVPVRNGPTRPRGSAPPPTNTGTNAEKTEAPPTIASQLTPQETVASQQETNQSINIAERNLASVRGKTLNASQTDLVSKIKGFLKDAREAAQAGDWKRARSLAKKAQVLSEELTGSF